mmetsp:Transcript_5180/g.8133  ORF Transcript_5180/g.8133 Transcript_5180/m.8133 type:complete len:81 (+) Transcript_5180:799-1041(+)
MMFFFSWYFLDFKSMREDFLYLAIISQSLPIARASLRDKKGTHHFIRHCHVAMYGSFFKNKTYSNEIRIPEMPDEILGNT